MFKSTSHHPKTWPGRLLLCCLVWETKSKNWLPNRREWQAQPSTSTSFKSKATFNTTCKRLTSSQTDLKITADLWRTTPGQTLKSAVKSTNLEDSYTMCCPLSQILFCRQKNPVFITSTNNSNKCLCTNSLPKTLQPSPLETLRSFLKDSLAFKPKTKYS